MIKEGMDKEKTSTYSEETVLAAYEEMLLPEYPDHPNLLGARGNLAITRMEQGDLEGARELQKAVGSEIPEANTEARDDRPMPSVAGGS